MRGRGDGGFVTVWTIALSVACLFLVGLAFDGGRFLRARSDAYGAAAASARAGAQEVDEAQAVMGELVLDEDEARAAALAYLAARGYDGAEVDVTDQEVTVTVTDDVGLHIVDPPGSVGFTVVATARAVQTPEEVP